MTFGDARQAIAVVDWFRISPEGVSEVDCARVLVEPLIDDDKDVMLRVESLYFDRGEHGFYLHLNRDNAEALARELIRVSHRGPRNGS